MNVGLIIHTVSVMVMMSFDRLYIHVHYMWRVLEIIHRLPFLFFQMRSGWSESNSAIHQSNHRAGDLLIPVPAGHASFRLLCHSSRIGGMIGKSGSVINALRIATASKIHVDTAAGAEVSNRVVTVVASVGPPDLRPGSLCGVSSTSAESVRRQWFRLTHF